MTETFYPESLDELAEVVRREPRLRVIGTDSKQSWLLPFGHAPVLSSSRLTGIVDFSPNDQVVAVRAGSLVADVQDELAKHGQCLPLGPLEGVRQGTIGGELSLNLPHTLEAECGSWRDWVLGMTLVLADGTIAKSGSHAVKSVAGYDIHKLIIGARGSLAVVAEVILRTYPVKSLPKPNVLVYDAPETGRCAWVQRTKRSDFTEATKASASFAGIDITGTSTLLRWLGEGMELPRFEGDWVMRSNVGSRNLVIEDSATNFYMTRTRTLFDPEGKFSVA